MRKIIILSFLAVIMLWSCKSESSQSSNIDTPAIAVDSVYNELDTVDMQNISMVEYNLNLALKLPVVANAAGQEIKPEVDHIDGDYLWYITIGDYFKLIIEDYAKEFNKVLGFQKRLEAQKDVFKVTYLIETPHLIFYKRELIKDNGGLPTFHCFAEISIDGYNYVMRSETFGGYEQVIEDMVLSIKTAHPVN